MKTKALTYQSLADIVLQETGSIAALFEVATANGISITATPEPGQEIEMPEGLSGDKEVANYLFARGTKIATMQEVESQPIGNFSYEPISAMEPGKNEIIAIDGQSLADLLLQLTGSVEGLFEFALINGKTIDYEPTPGERFKLPEGLVIDNNVLKQYKGNNIQPVTGLNAPEPQTLFELGLFEIGLFD